MGPQWPLKVNAAKAINEASKVRDVSPRIIYALGWSGSLLALFNIPQALNYIMATHPKIGQEIFFTSIDRKIFFTLEELKKILKWNVTSWEDGSSLLEFNKWIHK